MILFYINIEGNIEWLLKIVLPSDFYFVQWIKASNARKVIYKYTYLKSFCKIREGEKRGFCIIL